MSVGNQAPVLMNAKLSVLNHLGISPIPLFYYCSEIVKHVMVQKSKHSMTPPSQNSHWKTEKLMYFCEKVGFKKIY